jgi:hypothetical protein
VKATVPVASGAPTSPVNPGSLRWWLTKARQTKDHLLARVAPAEREALAHWLTPAQLDLFDRMHRADQRHGLRVVAVLRSGGERDEAVLVAGLLHDAGKGGTGVIPRILYSLEQAGIGWPLQIARLFPGVGASLDRLEKHAWTSARLAEAAGCPARTVELIRWQDAPRDHDAGERLRLADEAS